MRGTGLKKHVGFMARGFLELERYLESPFSFSFQILIEADRLTRIDITMKAAQHPCSKGEAQESAWPFQGRKAP